MAKLNRTRVREILELRKNGDVYPWMRVGHNRHMRALAGAIHCKYHNSIVVSLYPDAGCFLLDPCGYWTVSTRQAMNDFIGALGMYGQVSFAGGNFKAHILIDGAYRTYEQNETGTNGAGRIRIHYGEYGYTPEAREIDGLQDRYSEVYKQGSQNVALYAVNTQDLEARGQNIIREDIRKGFSSMRWERYASECIQRYRAEIGGVRATRKLVASILIEDYSEDYDELMGKV